MAKKKKKKKVSKKKKTVRKSKKKKTVRKSKKRKPVPSSVIDFDMETMKKNILNLLTTMTLFGLRKGRELIG